MAINQQSITEDRASGAQVIEGSTTFNSALGQYLKRTPSSNGNQRTWTYSVWFKRGIGTWGTTDEMHLLDAKTSGTKNFYGIYIGGNNDGDKISYWETHDSGGTTYYWAKQPANQRDFQGWYHLVFNYDTTQSTSSERIRFFINGVNNGLESENPSYPWPAEDYQGAVNSSDANHMIGSYEGARAFSGQMSNIHFLDGVRLDASHFGYTDPLTGTWRPKTFTGDYQSNGVNTFTSGTGGYPILNTNGNGTATASGYRTDKNPSGTDVSSYLSLAIPGSGGSIADVSADVKGSGSNKSISADNGDPSTSTTESNWYGKSVHLDGDDSFTCGSGSDYAVGTSDFTAEGWFWFNSSGSSQCLMEWDNNSSATGSPSGRSDGGQWYYSSGGNKLHWYQNSSNFATGTTITAQEWTHLAVVVTGGTMKFYKNGTESASSSYSLDLGNTDGNLRIGLQGGTFFNGYINDFRFYKGVAKYTSAFTPAPNTGGINSFYLPLDGSGPIWADQSGLGNNWTPTNGLPTTTQVDKATGALPVYNTQAGGNIIASPTIRGQAGIAVTVYNPTGSQNRYYFDGVEAPSYNFARGQNVTFDLSDSTVATHQLKFSTTSDGTHGGGSAYDTGTAYGSVSAGSVGAATTITFPHDAENTLYYYCVNHSGMGGSVGLTTDIQRADTYASNCVLAVPLYDVEDGTSWEDVSYKMNPNSAEKTITDNGARCRSGYWHNYGRGCYFDASNDYVSIASGYADLGLGSGAFTIEGWAYTGTDGTANQVIITSQRYYQGGYDGNWIIRRSNSSQLLFGSFDGTGNDESNQFTCNFSKDDWHHFAFVRNSTGTNGCTMYVDGIDCGNMTVSKDLDDGNTSGIYIGSEHSSGPGDNLWDGFIQDIRIYKGVAKYTSSFIPASPRPAVRLYNPGSSYNKLFKQPTCGSVCFNSSKNNDLSFPDSSDWDLGSNDWTVEGWVFLTKDTQWMAFASQSVSSATSDSAFYFGVGTSGIHCYVSTDGSSWNTNFNSQGRMKTESWYHVAFTRYSNMIQGYINGKLVGSASFSGTIYNSGRTLRIGTQNGSGGMDGLISNFRFVNGTALYPNQEFTPSTEPLTTTSQGATASEVKLLCCNTFDVVGLTTGPSSAVKTGTAFRDSTTATRNWDQSSTSSSRSNALGPDDIFWVDLGETVTLNNVTFDVDSTAGTNLSLTNFQVFYSAASDSYGSGVCYTGGGCGGGEVDASVGGPISGGASGEAVTNTVTFDFVSSSVTPPTGIRYVGLTNGSGSYGGSLTYYNVRVNTAAVTTSASTTMPSATAGNPFDNDVDFYQAESASYATWNPLDNECGNLGEAGLKGGVAGTAGWRFYRATVPLNTGKYYWELYDIGGGWASTDGSNGYMTGYCLDSTGFDIDGQDPNSNSTGLWGRQHTQRYTNNSSNSVTTEFGSTAAYSCIAYAYDADTQKLWTSYNGMWECGGNPSEDKIPTWINVTAGGYPMGGSYGSSIYVYANFGQKPFRYQPPRGFGPVCLSNTKRAGNATPSNAMGVVKWTGDGNSPRKIEGFDFPPDLVVYKERSEARDWQWYDTVRGVGPAKNLSSNTDYAQDSNDDTQYGYTSAFNHNGFTLTDGTAGGNGNIYTNKSGETYVSYCWKAGGNKNTFNINGVGYATAAAAGLTGGDITPTGASINTEAGFSIIKYVGTGNDGDTVAHGLTKEPAFVIVKKFEESGNWGVYHQGLSANTKVLTLNSTNAEFTPTDKFFTWSSTTTDLLGLGFNTITNDNTEGTVAYLWADIPGVQKFGSYVGNGDSSSGVFAGLDFRPSLLIIKNITDAGEGWVLWDNVRQTYNNGSTTTILYPNTYQTEGDDSNDWDILSNGMKWRSAGNMTNKDGSTYIYCAWSDIPLHNLYGAAGVGR